MNNRKEFEALAERYCTITLQEIEKAWEKSGFITMSKLTGFGDMTTCSLCDTIYKSISAFRNELPCPHCEWVMLTMNECNNEVNEKTYFNFINATTPKELLKACRKRGLYMKKLIQKSHE